MQNLYHFVAPIVGLTRANVVSEEREFLTHVVSEPGETRSYFEKPGKLQEAGETTRTPGKQQNTTELGSLFRLI